MQPEQCLGRGLGEVDSPVGLNQVVGVPWGGKSQMFGSFDFDDVIASVVLVSAHRHYYFMNI